MGVLCFIYLICALRTNIVFCLLFALLIPAFTCLGAALWKIAEATPTAFAESTKLIHASGALGFAVALLGWYLLIVQLLASVDFPVNLPVGDLSRFIKGASEKIKAS